MKSIKKACAVILTLIMIMSVFPQAFAAGDKLPYVGGLKWAAKIGAGWQVPAGEPMVKDDKIFIMAGSELLTLDKETGDVLKRTQMDSAQSYGYTPLLYAENMMFAALSGGVVEAFDSAAKKVWTYTDEDAVAKTKAMTAVTYSDGAVYTGFWNSETESANFVCLDAYTGKLKWKKSIEGGVYQAGACFTENAVIFGTDNGSKTLDKSSHLYSLNKKTGDVISDIELPEAGDVRSAAVIESGRVYAVSKGGYIISALLSGDELTDVKCEAIGAASTSAPVIYGDRIYIGAGDKTVKVIDKNTLEVILSVPMPAYPQCKMLVSADNLSKDGYLYIYSTYNAKPGGVKLIKIKPDAKDSDGYVIEDFFNPTGYEQYCISSVVSDNDGVLYYKNDSGYLFALEQKKVNVSVSLSGDGFIIPKTQISVPVGLAEKYGYKNASPVTDKDVSVLDAYVRLHEIMFGEDFTPDTAKNYLDVTESGWVNLFMGDSNGPGFTVNGKFPHDDNYTEWGYTGYLVNQSVVNDGDSVEIFYYRDSDYLDYLADFSYMGQNVKTLNVNAGNEFKLELSGYYAMYYGYYDDETIESMREPLWAYVYTVNETTGERTLLGETDENGEISLSFDTPGKYVISAGEMEDDIPIISPWLEVNVLGVKAKINDNKSVTINAFVENDISVTAVAAGYEEGIMVSAVKHDIELKKGANQYTFDISGLKGDVIKTFIWDGNLSPVE